MSIKDIGLAPGSPETVQPCCCARHELLIILNSEISLDSIDSNVSGFNSLPYRQLRVCTGFALTPLDPPTLFNNLAWSSGLGERSARACQLSIGLDRSSGEEKWPR
jgi:hypothetical protein